ncbi:MAG: hypothetical protein WCI04_03475 [archaeon]
MKRSLKAPQPKYQNLTVNLFGPPGLKNGGPKKTGFWVNAASKNLRVMRAVNRMPPPPKLKISSKKPRK